MQRVKLHWKDGSKRSVINGWMNTCSKIPHILTYFTGIIFYWHPFTKWQSRIMIILGPNYAWYHLMITYMRTYAHPHYLFQCQKSIDLTFRYIPQWHLNRDIRFTVRTARLKISMMTSSNGNIFRVTGHLCGEFTGLGEFPPQRPVTRNFDVYFDLRLNKRLCKQS